MRQAFSGLTRRLRAEAWRLRLAATGDVLQHYRYLRRMTEAPKEAVAAAQAERLSALLRHASEKVPFYRETLREAGVVDGGRVRLDRFQDLPLLDKGTIRSHLADLTSSDSAERGSYKNTSGGSTGEPVTFVQDRGTHEWKVAVKQLFDSWTGYRPGQGYALLWGAGRDLDDTSLKARVGMWLRNELRFDSYLMEPATMDEYIAELNSFSPGLLLAYAQSAYQLALHAERSGARVRPPGAIMTSATTLEPKMRAKIEEVFGAKVFDRYGSREVGDIACENGDGHGLLISPLTHLVEVLDEAGRPAPHGVAGEIVVTLLTNYSMPLVRFRIGDAGILAAATGDVAWPRLEQVIGRVTDIFYTRAGKQVYGGYFTRQFYDRDWVNQFQIVQEDYEKIRVRIVPNGVVSPASWDAQQRELTAAFREALGDACQVEFELVESIEPGPTGKRRYTISNVERPT